MQYRAEIIITWDQIQDYCAELARQILDRGLRHERILAVTRGGLFPAGILARELDIREIDTVGVAGYTDQSRSESRLIKDCAANFKSSVLVVDDLVDTGQTFELLHRGGITGTYATLFAKPEGREQTDLYLEDVDQHVWVRFPWDTRRQYVPPLIRNFERNQD